jgi:hypothetical protein
MNYPAGDHFSFDPARDSKRTPRSAARNYRARKAVETLPSYVDSRSDNISLLGASLAAILPFLKERR